MLFILLKATIDMHIAEPDLPCDANPCVNGECENGPLWWITNYYKCKCEEGWIGKNCDEGNDVVS